MDVGSASSVAATQHVDVTSAVRARDSVASPGTPATRGISARNSSIKDGDQVDLSSEGRQMSGIYARRTAMSSTREQDASADAAVGKVSSSDTQKQDPELERMRQLVQEELQKQEKAVSREEGKNSGDSSPEDAKEVNLTSYEEARVARLDHIELLIDEGKYSVDNFMVDRVAVELARYMV